MMCFSQKCMGPSAGECMGQLVSWSGGQIRITSWPSGDSCRGLLNMEAVFNRFESQSRILGPGNCRIEKAQNLVLQSDLLIEVT